MKNTNRILIFGRLTRDPEFKTTTNSSLVNFSIAVNHAQNETSFFEVTAWKKLAELARDYLTKGQQVIIEGYLKQQTWKNSSGQTQSKVVIIADGFEMIGKKSNANPKDQDNDYSPMDDDVPF